MGMTAGWPASGGFVGRVGELATATGVLTGLVGADGRTAPAVLAVTGDPGIGKTRLLAELCARARGHGHVVIGGTATELEQHLPFGALVESFDSWLRWGERGSGRFEHAMTELLLALSAASPDQVGGAGGSAWFGPHRRIRAVLEDLAGPRGLMVVLDDVHWADAALVELIGYLLRRPPRGRFLLALAYRPRQVDQRVEDAVHGAAPGLAHELRLGPLSDEESGEIVGPGLARAARDSLIRDGGGNPLFLTALRQAAGRSQRPLAGEDEDLPPAVRSALLSELRGLPSPTVAAARAAAVAGDPFDYGLVAAVADVSETEAVRLVDQLVKRDVMRQIGHAPRFRFRHPLLRRVVYTAMSAGTRREAHRRAAAALQSHGATPVLCAYHVARYATPGDTAAARLLADAAAAILWRAAATCVWLLQESLRLLPAGQDGHHGRTLMLVRALMLTGRLREGREAAHALLAGLPDTEPAARATAATIDRLLGHHARARAVLLGELDRLDQNERRGPHDDAIGCTIRLELVTGGLLAGDFTPEGTDIRNAVAAAERTANRTLTAAAATVSAFASYATGRYADALCQLDAATRLVDALPTAELARRLDTAVWLAWTEVFCERFDVAIERFTGVLALIHSTGQGHLATYVLVGIAQAYAQAGRSTEAAEWAADAVEAAEQSTSDELRTMAYTLQCLAATHLDDLETALDAGARAVAAAGAVRDWWAASAGMVHAQARLAAGVEPVACREEMLRAGGGPRLGLVDPGHRPYFYGALARAELANGDTRAALAWADRMDRAVARLGPTAHHRAGMARLLRARVLLAAGLPAQAAEHALAALRAFDGVDARFFAGHAHLAASRALIAAGDRAAGLAHARRAQQTFTELAAHRHARHAVRTQRRAGHRVSPPGRSGLGALTRREAEVAHLVAQGHTNHQIARRLRLSDRTVESHVRHICTKLDVGSRTAVAAAVARQEATRATS